MAFQVTIPVFPPTTKPDCGIIHQSILWIGFFDFLSFCMVGQLLGSISKRKVGGPGWVRAPLRPLPPVIHFSHPPVFLEYLEPAGRNFLSERESHSVMSDSLQLHGLHSSYNSPVQNTGVGSLCLLQGIFPTQGSNPGLPHCRRILYQLSRKGSPSSESSP